MHAGAIIAYRNPSSVAEPSPSDLSLTGRVDLFDEVDVRLLGRMVVSRPRPPAWASRGLI